MAKDLQWVMPVIRHAQFTTTHWSVVLAAGRAESPEAKDALSKLCHTYWYPLYVFVRREGYNPPDAEDLTQEFFSRLLEREDLNTVKPEEGRFRSFLLASLKHLLANERRRLRTQKRGAGQWTFSLDGESPESRYRLEPADPATPVTLFERRWALTVMERVMGHLRQEFIASERADLFEELKGFLLEKKAAPRAEIAARFGVSLNAVDVAIHRLRKRYAELLRNEIAQTVRHPEEVDEEIRYLIAALGE